MISEGFKPDRIVCVPNGVSGIKPYKRRRPIGGWTLGIAALFRPRKGIEVLLEAVAALKGQGFDVRLRAIGPFETREYQTEVLAKVERLGIADAVDWTGFVGDIHAELRRVDLFVLPSLFGEGLPMVVLEAMAAGLPVVASDVEGIPVAIRQGVDGLLVEPNDRGALAEAIREIIRPDSPLDYQTMCRNAREQHAAKFSAEAMARGVARVYREVLKSRD
jgi:glycosyltransferase involved in cell wall biosynthesis